MTVQLPNGSVGDVLSIYPIVEVIAVIHKNVVRCTDIADSLEEANGIIINLADGLSLIIGNLKNEDIIYILDSLFVDEISFDFRPYNAVQVISKNDFIDLKGRTYYEYLPLKSYEALPFYWCVMEVLWENIHIITEAL